MAGEFVTLYRVTRANGKSRIGSRTSMALQVANWKVNKASHERQMALRASKGQYVWDYSESKDIVSVEAITINPEEWMNITKETLSSE